MVTDKTCETCEYFAAGKSRCVLRHILTARCMDCPLWRGRHGEWICSSTALPEDREFVILPDGDRYSYVAEYGLFERASDCFDRIPASDIKCWLRLPNDDIFD